MIRCAAGLMIVMIGATIFHIARGEIGSSVTTTVLRDGHRCRLHALEGIADPAASLQVSQTDRRLNCLGHPHDKQEQRRRSHQRSCCGRRSHVGNGPVRHGCHTTALAIRRHDSAQRRHVSAQRCIVGSSSSRSHSLAHASHTSAHTPHVLV